MENVNETMNPNETNETKETYPRTLCGLIPLTLEPVPINPNAVDWELWNADNVLTNRKRLLKLRKELLVAENADVLQRCEDEVIQLCDDYMEILFGLNIDHYISSIKEINEFKTVQYPQNMPYILLIDDTITVHTWMESHLRMYQTLREIHTEEESVSIMKDIIYAGGTFDPTTDIPDEDLEEEEDVEATEHWDGADDTTEELIREGIINDNHEFVNNPDNMTDEDLRRIINSFNDDHSVSGLLED